MIEQGTLVFIRTVTMYYFGEYVNTDSNFIELKDAKWIVDTGRFSDFLKTGLARELEPFINNVYVSINSIIDITEWSADADIPEN